MTYGPSDSTIKVADDSKVVHSTDMRKPASEVASINEVVKDNGDGSISFGGLTITFKGTVTGNFNNYMKTGLYTYSTANGAISNSIGEAPDGILIVLSQTNGNVYHFLISSYSERYFRVYMAGAWHDWRKQLFIEDLTAGLATKADDSKVVHSTDMRKPASDVAGIEEVNTKQDKISYTPADDSKVLHTPLTQLNSTDMNTVLTAGFYRLNSGTNGMPLADKNDNWTIYQVIPLTDSNGVQIAYQTNHAILGMRSWNNWNKFTSWVTFADDSKVVHLSGANNFDTTPTVNNNPLLLASSLPFDPARTGSNQDDPATLLDINTNKAVYNASEKVIFHATSVSGHGHLVVKYYHLNHLVATKDIYYGTSELSWSWFLPADDNTSYAVIIENHVDNNVSTNTIAINVSNNIYNFPIMGFLSRYDSNSPVEMKQNLDYLKRLHINLVEMYDWFDLHSLPLPVSSNGDSLQVSNTWTDIGNRLTKVRVIEDYCNLAKERGIKSLAYMAMNGSDTNQLIHGLTAEMFLYDDNSKNLDHVYKTLDMSKGWGKYSLYITNWMDGPWQDYIVHQMEIVRNNMPFDGWHIDMFGDPGDKYQGDGNPISSATLAGGIHYFLDKANNLGWDTGINSVGEYGLTDIRKSTVPKYLYTEVWDNRKTYDDLFQLVKFITESRDSHNTKKGAIIAAYMDCNFAKSNQGKNFNDDGVILTDLVIMASGGMHLEMGEHMLCNEYFPDNNLNISDNLKNIYLPEMYDFFVAFKEIIGLGYQVDGLATIDGGSVDSLQSGKVCGISRGNKSDYLGLSLINLRTTNTEWRDTNANCSVTPAQNIKVTLKLGVTNHKWYYFDLSNLEPKELDVGADGVVNISSLKYYGFILGVPKK